MDVWLSVISSALVCGGLQYLAQTWLSERLKSSIQHEYAQKLETYKATVKAENDVEIERMKSQLAITAAEHNLKFSRTYDQMAAVIAEIYRQTSELYISVAHYINPAENPSDGSKADRRTVVNSKLAEFSDFFYAKRLYLPQDTAKRVEAFRNRLHDIASKFAANVEKPRSGGMSSQMEAWGDSWNELKNEITPVRDELEREFRKLLGTNG